MPEENPYTAPVEDPRGPEMIGGAPGPHNYAGRGARLVGALIDGLIMIPVAFLFLTILLPVFGAEVADLSIFERMGTMSLMGSIVLALLIMATHIAIQWTFWKSTSQSIGKKVMKTQIVNLDGTPADVHTIAFKRYAIMAVLGVIPFRVGDLIGFLDAVLIFRAEHNCLHDDIAQTRVIQYSPEKP